MATIINGTSMKLYVDLPNDASAADLSGANTSLVGVAQSCSLSITIDTPDITTKDDNDRKEFAGLATSWTVDAENFYTEGGTDETFLNFFQVAYGTSTTDTPIGMANRPRTCYVKFDCSGDYYHGLGYISSLSLSAGVEDASVYSVTIQGAGELTKAS